MMLYLYLLATLLPTAMSWFNGENYCGGKLDSYVRLECEEGKKNLNGDNSSQIDYRFGASDMHTVFLKKNGQSELYFNLCLKTRTEIRINSFFVTNDGGEDTLLIDIGNEQLAQVKSKATFNGGGKYWNVIQKARIVIDNKIVVDPGTHVVKVKAYTDQWGVTADVIELKLTSLSGEFERGHCDANFTATEMVGGAFQCLKDIPSFNEVEQWVPSPESNGWAECKSYKVGCAEEDNVDVRIFQKNTKRFRIVATPPMHLNCTKLDMKITDFRNCDEKHFKKYLWSIGKYDNKSNEFPFLGKKTLQHAGRDEMKNAEDFTRFIDGNTGDLVITFMAKGTTYGLIDSNVGGRLTVTFASVASPGLSLRAFATGRNGEIEIGHQSVSEITNATFDIPDFTWKEGEGNEIRIKVEGQGYAEFDFLRLDKRKENGRIEIRDVFKSPTHAVTSNIVDFWWQAPDMMELIITGGDKTYQQKVTWFKIIKNVYMGHWAEFFVLYQDGNSRLLPLPDRNTAWWPFGSSVIIGRPTSPPNAHRPFAPIQKVELDGPKMTMDITYKSGDRISMKVDGGTMGRPATIESTSIDIQSTEDYPILTLRSMYIRDGNSDTDSVVSDASPNKRYTIVDDFEKLPGNSFHFFKMCTSMHNTRSPDIHVDVSA